MVGVQGGCRAEDGVRTHLSHEVAVAAWTNSIHHPRLYSSHPWVLNMGENGCLGVGGAGAWAGVFVIS